jgi:hypothetical protein
MKNSKFFWYRGKAIHTPIESSGQVDKKYVFKNVFCDLSPKKA